jgi:hypothetical protein
LIEERRLRVSECRVLRLIFVPKREEVTSEWGKVHNEEQIFLLLTQYYSGDYEMGAVFSTYVGEERHIQEFGEEN